MLRSWLRWCGGGLWMLMLRCRCGWMRSEEKVKRVGRGYRRSRRGWRGLVKRERRVRGPG
jgi:hypothetical protein